MILDSRRAQFAEGVRNAFVGLLTGTLCAVGGAAKDAPYEGFKPRTFLRSPICGVIGGLLATFLTTDVVLVAAFAGYFERCVVEAWKIIRSDVPDKFTTGQLPATEPGASHGKGKG